MTRAIPSSGYHVRAELPNRDEPLRLSTFAEPEWSPSVRDRPELELDVAQRGTWVEDVTGQQPARCWLDGERLPIDRIVEANTQTGRTTTLTMSGGAQLERRVQTTVNSRPAWEVVKGLVENNTDYAANVDEPQVDPIAGQLLQSASTELILEDVFGDALSDTTPATVVGDSIETQQTSFLQTTDDLSTSAFVIDSSDSAYQTSEDDDAVMLSGERGSPVTNIATVTPAVDSVSVQMETENNAVVRLYDDNGNLLDFADGAGGTVDFASEWIDVDTGGTAVHQIEVADTDGLPDNETVSVASDIGGAGDVETATVNVSDGQSVSLSYTPPYTMPANAWELAVRQFAYLPNNEPLDQIRLEVSVDGTVISKQAGPSSESYSWDNVLASGALNNDVSASTQHDITITLRNGAASGGGKDDAGVVLDGIAPYDSRYGYTFDNSPETTDDPPRFAGPENYPDAVQLVTPVVISQLSILKLTVTVEMDDTSNGQAVAVSGDGGSTWHEDTNTTSTSKEFDPAVDRGNARITLSGYGTQSASPQQRAQPQTLTSYELTATQSNVPRLIDEHYDDSLENILRDIADDVNAVWELQYDDAADQFTVEWTRPGQREASGTAEPSEVSITRDSTTVADAATVVGGRQTRSGESWTADVGAEVLLDRERIIPGTEQVSDPDTGEVYEANVDYKLGLADGTITALADGDLVDGSEYEITYEHKVAGRFESQSWSGDAETDIRADIPQLSSPAACRQAAARLVQRTTDATYEADVKLTDLDPTQSVIEALSVAVLPDDLGPWDIRHLVVQPGSVGVVLGAGITVEDELEQVRQSVGRVGRKV